MLLTARDQFVNSIFLIESHRPSLWNEVTFLVQLRK